MKFLLPAAFCLMSTSAFAQGDQLSVHIGEVGIRAAIAELESTENLSPDQRFALGGLHFLGAIERTLQTRYTYGVGQNEILQQLDIPLLRLPIPENPTPAAFDPAVIETLFVEASADFSKAITVLDTIGDDDDFGLKIDTGHLWFDINMNDTRDPGEGLVAALASVQRFNDGVAPDITVRFDTSDAKWLSAYAHLLSGISDTIVALHPAERIGAFLADAQALEAFTMKERYRGYFGDEVQIADMITLLVDIFETRPDAEYSRSAHAHFLAMIRDNRIFWARVAAETDNVAEWIPNANQTSALPLTFPPETAEIWGAVLSEAEEVLDGRRLIWHWRFEEGTGINLATLMQDPPEIDIIGMIQGRTFLPHVERGPTMDGQAINNFWRLMGGDAGLFAVILN